MTVLLWCEQEKKELSLINLCVEPKNCRALLFKDLPPPQSYQIIVLKADHIW